MAFLTFTIRLVQRKKQANVRIVSLSCVLRLFVYARVFDLYAVQYIFLFLPLSPLTADLSI